MCCSSRSTATTSSPRVANNRAWRPVPQATSSTGPRSTSAAKRVTQGDGVSISRCLLGAPDDALVERIETALPIRVLVAARERALDGVEVFAPPAGSIAHRGESPGAVRCDGEGARLFARQELGVALAPLGAQVQ